MSGAQSTSNEVVHICVIRLSWCGGCCGGIWHTIARICFSSLMPRELFYTQVSVSFISCSAIKLLGFAIVSLDRPSGCRTGNSRRVCVRGAKSRRMQTGRRENHRGHDTHIVVVGIGPGVTSRFGRGPANSLINPMMIILASAWQSNTHQAVPRRRVCVVASGWASTRRMSGLWRCFVRLIPAWQPQRRIPKHRTRAGSTKPTRHSSQMLFVV